MITVHHLDFSRSTRVLWLLEELGVAYELVRYRREAGGPAPAALTAVHPLGTSPVVVDDGFVLAESSAILRYVDREHGGRFTPSDAAARAEHDQWIDRVEGSLALPVLVTLMGGRELPERIAGKMRGMIDKDWGHVDAILSRRSFLMGDRLTLADMQISYVTAIARSAGLLDAFPAVTDHLDRMLALPALRRAIEAGGPMTP